MLQQLESSGQSNTQQFVSIRNRIIESMISLQDQFDFIDYETLKELKQMNKMLVKENSRTILNLLKIGMKRNKELESPVSTGILKIGIFAQ